MDCTCTRGSGMTGDEASLSALMNSHIPHYSTSGVGYTVGYRTCQHQAGAPPGSPLQNRKSILTSSISCNDKNTLLLYTCL